jgi:hypothetical protein
MPNGAKCLRARNAQQRQMPNSAKCPTARNAQLREMPNSAKSPTASTAADAVVAAVGALGHLAPLGIRRRWAFGAVGHSAPLGIRRRWASGAVGHLAPLGIWRRWASGAVGHLAPLGIWRRWASGAVGHSALSAVESVPSDGYRRIYTGRSERWEPTCSDADRRHDSRDPDERHWIVRIDAEQQPLHRTRPDQ